MSARHCFRPINCTTALTLTLNPNSNPNPNPTWCGASPAMSPRHFPKLNSVCTKIIAFIRVATVHCALCFRILLKYVSIQSVLYFAWPALSQALSNTMCTKIINKIINKRCTRSFETLCCGAQNLFQKTACFCIYLCPISSITWVWLLVPQFPPELNTIFTKVASVMMLVLHTFVFVSDRSILQLACPALSQALPTQAQHHVHQDHRLPAGAQRHVPHARGLRSAGDGGRTSW